jgi:DNA-binding response OmpR family regulator
MAKRNSHILVIDDKTDSCEMLRLMLTLEGFEVTLASDGRSGIRAAYEHHPDAVLLDVMMPRVDGFEVCRRLRDVTEVPIVFLTARANIEDVVKGFSVGGDDYITKPYKKSELISRLRATLRRSQRESDVEAEALFPTDSIMLDCHRHQLTIKDRTIYLTPTEFEVLRLMIRRAGKVLSRDAILTRVWGPEFIGDPDLVKQYIYRLRQKIEPDVDSPRYIHTIRDRGYYFEAYAGA